MKVTRDFTVQGTQEDFTVEIEFKIEEIARTLAARAHRSKVGKAVALGGDVMCKVVKRSPAAKN